MDSENAKAEVKASLIRQDALVIYIGAAPEEVFQKRMPKTFEKLVAIIEKEPELTTPGA